MTFNKQPSSKYDVESIVVTEIAEPTRTNVGRVALIYGGVFIAGLFFIYINNILAFKTIGALIGKHALEIVPLFIAGIVTLVIGSRHYKTGRAESRLLRLVSVDETGITLGVPGKGRYNFYLTWDRVSGILVWDSDEEDSENPGGLMIGATGNMVYQLRHDVAFEWVQEQELIARARTFAPHVNLAIPVREKQGKNPRYTNLWLQYFASPDARKRKGMLEPGDFLHDGAYEIEELLGGGGQGTAYRARQHLSEIGTNEAEVVLKEYVLPVHKNEALEQGKTSMLMSEADILSKISHPQVVKLLDCFIEDHRGYLVLEFIRGMSLRELVKRQGPQAESVVREWSLQVANILGYLHSLSQPVIHRDLTPDNLILSEEGLIKLVDFTVAHQFDTVRLATVVGKQCYIAPEQLRGFPTPQSDLYSLGATMYFLLTGEDPEPLTSSHPRQAVSSISEELDEVVAKATELVVEKRFQSAMALVDVLSRGS